MELSEVMVDLQVTMVGSDSSSNFWTICRLFQLFPGTFWPFCNQKNKHSLVLVNSIVAEVDQKGVSTD